MKSKENKGITLIALVITIVVLIILAGVSINMVLGENGLFTKAKEATENMQLAQKEEEEGIDNFLNEIDEIVGTIEEELKEPQIKDYIDRKVDNNTTIYDKYNNKIVIPAGFKIVKNGEDNVDYNYTGIIANIEAEETIPSVQDGIVIKDDDGNEFVWVPVGTITNEDKTKTEIKLERRIFDENGNATIINANDMGYKEETKEERKNQEYENTIAKDIEAFKTSANANGGYYIARYEAGKESSNGKAISKQGTIWNSITQPEAATAAQSMYEDGDNFISDLVNSYAWDTAIMFIEKYSPKNSNYANQTSRNASSENTGERTNDNGESTTDKVCNIYDMASNRMEWETETYIQSGGPFVNRGGLCGRNDIKAKDRQGYNAEASKNFGTALTFRVILYINNTKE